MFDWMKSDDENRKGVWKLFIKRITFIIILAVAVVVSIAWSMNVGTADIGFFEVYQILINNLFPGTFDVIRSHEIIVNTVRGPRILMAMFVGFILATGGCIVQSILKNPLATPYTLGISSSACFGAALAIAFGLSLSTSTVAIICSAFLFSMVPVAVILIAATRRSVTPTTLVLCGVAISQVFGACNTILQYFSDGETAKEIVFWSVGSLNTAAMWMIPYVAVAALVFAVIAIYLSRDLNIMKMGDDTAESLGIDSNAVRVIAILVSCVCTAVAVSFTGAIGFICIICPHICRIIIGGDLRYLIPASMLFGGVFLIAADAISRWVLDPVILPVGAITAVIGGPLLVYLLMKRKSSMSI